MKDFPYNYIDGNYDVPALHRKSQVYDPKNTDNILILDYFNDIENKRRKDNTNIYHKLIHNDLEKYKDAYPPTFPVSFQMIYHDINIAWINIMYQMLFIDNAYSTFYAEYKEVIDNIISYDTIDVKESLVYRYFYTGESIFHIAGKIWLYEKDSKYEDIPINERHSNLNEQFKYMLECYENLETVMGKKFSIMYMTDFRDETLFDYLTTFLEDVKENRLS